jgi:hypothetical protein
MFTNTFWNTITQPQPYDFPIWAVLDSDKIYTVELLREPVALKWSKIKAWQPAQIPEAPKEHWEKLAEEHFQRKIETNNNILSSKDWFMEGVKYGKDQQHFSQKDSISSNTTLNTGSIGWSHTGYGAVPPITTANDLDRMLSNISLQLSSTWCSPLTLNTTGKEASCTQDEFKVKYKSVL